PGGPGDLPGHPVLRSHRTAPRARDRPLLLRHARGRGRRRPLVLGPPARATDARARRPGISGRQSRGVIRPQGRVLRGLSGAPQWDAWRQERLGYVLHRAATRVPYYRAQWAARRRQGDHASWEVLENWPILDNDRVREDPAAFIADDRNPRWMFNEHTSGTT